MLRAKHNTKILIKFFITLLSFGSCTGVREKNVR
jgi:hypothetical protein